MRRRFRYVFGPLPSRRLGRLKRIKDVPVAVRIGPDRVQLNTVARPPAERGVWPVPRERMERLATLFRGRVEIIADFRDRRGWFPTYTLPGDVLEFLRRRPATIGDLAGGLGMNPSEAVKILDVLGRRNLLRSRRIRGRTYFSILKPGRPRTNDPP